MREKLDEMNATEVKTEGDSVTICQADVMGNGTDGWVSIPRQMIPTIMDYLKRAHEELEAKHREEGDTK